MLALTWNDIDFEKRILSVMKTYHDGNEKLSELAVTQSHKSAAYKRTRTVTLRHIFEYTHRQIL